MTSRAVRGRFTPNLRATQVELFEGLAATGQNYWPSLKFDVGEVNDLLSPLIGAGFYYKTFMGPDFIGRLGLDSASTSRRSAASQASAPRRASPIPTAIFAPMITATC